MKQFNSMLVLSIQQLLFLEHLTCDQALVARLQHNANSGINNCSAVSLCDTCIKE